MCSKKTGSIKRIRLIVTSEPSSNDTNNDTYGSTSNSTIAADSSDNTDKENFKKPVKSTKASKRHKKSPNQSVVKTLSLIVHPRFINYREFDASKYVLTRLGYISKSIFASSVPLELPNCTYIDRFPPSLVSEVAQLINEPENVANFPLETLQQIPCHVPLRWGVIYNFKFRRVFKNLTLEKWKAIGKILRESKFADTEALTYYLRNGKDLETGAEESSSQESVVCDQFLPSPYVLPPPNFERAPSHIRIPNKTIYASHYADAEFVCDLKPRFSIRQVIQENECLSLELQALFLDDLEACEKVLQVLETLPIDIPLRWGFIFEKFLRRTTDKTPTLKQWNQVKNILSNHHYFRENNYYPNCVVLSNEPELKQ